MKILQSVLDTRDHRDLASGSATNRGSGFNATPRKGGCIRGGGSWLRTRDNFQRTQTTPSSHYRITEASLCQKCKVNHFENCIQERTCYNFGGKGYLKKNCSIVQGSQVLIKGIGGRHENKPFWRTSQQFPATQ